MSDVRTTKLHSGTEVPVLGQGTWGWAEDARRRVSEIASLRHGLQLGLSLVDTAEMYAGGGAEKLVGEAIAGRRDEVFLVSKVQPSAPTGWTSTCCIGVDARHWPKRSERSRTSSRPGRSGSGA